MVERNYNETPEETGKRLIDYIDVNIELKTELVKAKSSGEKRDILERYIKPEAKSIRLTKLWISPSPDAGNIIGTMVDEILGEKEQKKEGIIIERKKIIPLRINYLVAGKRFERNKPIRYSKQEEIFIKSIKSKKWNNDKLYKEYNEKFNIQRSKGSLITKRYRMK